MGKINEKILLILIFAFSVFLYFYKLSEIPGAMYIDEVMPAYNAYSILETARDEYKKFMPIVFRFYGSYNPPLYTYLTVIPIYLFGLNNFSARAVSALFGLLTSFVIYIFIRKLKLNNLSPIFALVLSLISPWIILYSRVGYEVSLGLFFFVLGSVLFYFSINNHKHFILGFIAFSLSTYSAYAERFVTPLFIVLFIIYFTKYIKNKYFLIGLIISFLMQIPNFYLLTTSAFFPKDDLFFVSSNGLVREILSRYFTYFSPRSLFFLPDPDLQRSIPELSVFYPWYFILYLLGLYKVWKLRLSDNKLFHFIVILLFISPIPAALTKDPFSTHRALPLFFPLIVVITFGIDYLYTKLKSNIVVTTLVLLIISSLFSLYRSYFVFLPKERAKEWGYGYSELSEEIKKRKDNVFVIDQSRIKPSYMYLAYYLRYPPLLYQLENDIGIDKNYYNNLDPIGEYSFSNIINRNIDWRKDICSGRVLVGDEFAISKSQAVEHNLTQIFEIRDPVDNIIFVGYKVNSIKKCN